MSEQKKYIARSLLFRPMHFYENLVGGELGSVITEIEASIEKKCNELDRNGYEVISLISIQATPRGIIKEEKQAWPKSGENPQQTFQAAAPTRGVVIVGRLKPEEPSA